MTYYTLEKLLADTFDAGIGVNGFYFGFRGGLNAYARGNLFPLVWVQPPNMPILNPYVYTTGTAPAPVVVHAASSPLTGQTIEISLAIFDKWTLESPGAYTTLHEKWDNLIEIGLKGIELLNQASGNTTIQVAELSCTPFEAGEIIDNAPCILFNMKVRVWC